MKHNKQLLWILHNVAEKIHEEYKQRNDFFFVQGLTTFIKIECIKGKLKIPDVEVIASTLNEILCMDRYDGIGICDHDVELGYLVIPPADWFKQHPKHTLTLTTDKIVPTSDGPVVMSKEEHKAMVEDIDAEFGSPVKVVINPELLERIRHQNKNLLYPRSSTEVFDLLLNNVDETSNDEVEASTKSPDKTVKLVKSEDADDSDD